MRSGVGVLWLAAAVALGIGGPVGVQAGEIDTEHVFGFMIGSDIGAVGERELQSDTTGRFGKAGGRYRAAAQELELELVPMQNLRVEFGSRWGATRVAAVPGFDDRQALGWQGGSVEFRMRFLDRATAPVGITLAVETGFSRIDEITAARVSGTSAGVTLALDREIVPDVAVAALNLSYQPEWTRARDTGDSAREAGIGAALGLLMQLRPGVLVGGEARYLRRYQGIGLDDLAGQALFVGPTIYLQLTERTRLTASWSMQLWGRSEVPGSALDLVNFERHQGRLVYGVNF